MIRGFNCLAETVLFTESRLLAEGFMSTHRHIIVQTDDPVDFGTDMPIAVISMRGTVGAAVWVKGKRSLRRSRVLSVC